MAVTIKELSIYCGLSISAVSKALNGYPDIGEETRQKVMNSAKELGYRPNQIARGLKTGKTFNLGVVYKDASNSGFTHNYFSPVMESFKNEAERHGYEISFISADFSANFGSKMSYLEHSRYRGVDGICVVCCDFKDARIKELAQSDIPLISIDQQLENCPCVASKNKEGMQLLTEYVIAHKHSRIAYIYGETGTIQEMRMEGFLTAMESHGIAVRKEWLIEGRFHNPQIARRVVRKLLQRAERPSCILMCDDYAALGAMHSLEEKKLHIPEDVSIAGYDGVPILQMLKPRLTTIQQNTSIIGSTAARQLIQIIEGKRKRRAQTTYIDTILLEGDTVGYGSAK